MITETKKGIFLSKTQKHETLVHQYLYEHIEMVPEPDRCYEVVKFLAHLFRDEIKCFVERVEEALVIAKRKRFEIGRRCVIRRRNILWSLLLQSKENGYHRRNQQKFIMI